MGVFLTRIGWKANLTILRGNFSFFGQDKTANPGNQMMWAGDSMPGEEEKIALEDSWIAFEEEKIAFEDSWIAFEEEKITFEDGWIAFEEEKNCLRGGKNCLRRWWDCLQGGTACLHMQFGPTG